MLIGQRRIAERGQGRGGIGAADKSSRRVHQCTKITPATCMRVPISLDQPLAFRDLAGQCVVRRRRRGNAREPGADACLLLGEAQCPPAPASHSRDSAQQQEAGIDVVSTTRPRAQSRETIALSGAQFSTARPSGAGSVSATSSSRGCRNSRMRSTCSGRRPTSAATRAKRLARVLRSAMRIVSSYVIHSARYRAVSRSRRWLPSPHRASSARTSSSRPRYVRRTRRPATPHSAAHPRQRSPPHPRPPPSAGPPPRSRAPLEAAANAARLAATPTPPRGSRPRTARARTAGPPAPRSAPNSAELMTLPVSSAIAAMSTRRDARPPRAARREHRGRSRRGRRPAPIFSPIA